MNVRRNGKWVAYTNQDGLSGDMIRSIVADHSGDIWIGTPTGLQRFREGKFERFTTANGLPDNNIFALFTDSLGTLWIGASQGGVCCYRDGKFTAVPGLSVPNTAICRAFAEDSTGAIWIGTNSAGIYVVKGNHITRVTSQTGLSKDSILSIVRGSDGVMWVSTHGGGLNRFSGNTWTHFDTSNGIPDNIIYHIVEEGPHLWLSSTKGVLRVRKDELQDSKSQVRALRLGRNDGMRILDCNGGTQPAGCRTHDGWIWFPTDLGLVSINPARVQINQIQPTLFVDHILADGLPIVADGPITIPPGRGVLEFHYTAIDLSAPENVRFRYKLEGYDSDWIEAGGRRIAYYTNLPPNKYQFRVTACNGDGVWQEIPTSLELVLRPHFYQTFWFYAICVLGLATLITAGHLYRTRRHRLHAAELARCVAERTRQLQEEVAEHARTGELLRQSQKLEAVGQLAGGIAHDFNNLLTVINGFGELLLETVTLEPQQREMLEEMISAGHRAAGLTSQLLAFSRRQVLAPKVLDPNEVVIELQKLIGRLIGEHITLTTRLDPGVSHVKADPVQLQQVLINLCVNARDAMPRGGNIRIETRNVMLSQDAQLELAGHAPGSYVLLNVTDTGCGMTDAVRSRIFEPLFTTKSFGKGTGLGLATVYGIVRQSGGHVTVSSEIDVGTTFRIYLPSVHGEKAQSASSMVFEAAPRGMETILLVEDEPSVLAMARHLLLSCGYSILEASDGLSALRVAQAYSGQIDLLVSDVVMPHLSGRELAEALRNEWPDLRVLYVSGYTDDVVLHHGVSDETVSFLQKPYSPAQLAFKVRAVLDGLPSSLGNTVAALKPSLAEESPRVG